MKISILTFTLAAILYLLPNNIQAQGKLEFNQVIYNTIPASGNVPISVPAGKVWKIETAGCGTTTSGTVVFLKTLQAKMSQYYL